MIRKILTNTLFFIFVFTVISVIADIHSHYRLVHQEPEKKGWTCRCDFRVFWTAGHKLYNYIFSRPAHSQDPEYQEELEDYIGGDNSRVYDESEPFYHFRYSPLTAFFMLPLALITYPSNALVVWLIVINAALLASLLLLTRQISSDFNISRNVRYLILWGTFMVSMKFYLMTLSIGQCDTLIALFFVLFLMAYARNQDIVCGIVFAVIIQFKLLFLPMLLYFLFTGKRRLVLSAAFGSLALFLAPAVVIGFGKTAALLKDWAGILAMSVPSQILNFKNQSVIYFIGKSLLNINALNLSTTADRLFCILSAVFTISAYVALLVFKRSLKAKEDKKFKYLEISLLIIITLLFSPLVWIAHFVCLIIPAGVMILFLSASRNRKGLYFALAIFLIFSVAVGTDLTKFIPVLNKSRFMNIAIGTFFLAYALIHSYKQIVSGDAVAHNLRK